MDVVEAKARADAVVQALQKSRRKVILPAPACAELLTAIGPDAQQYLNIFGQSRVLEVGNFDARGAAELALLNRGIFAVHDLRDKAEPYQKVKVDRQIIAICKVYGASEFYADDRGMATRARMCGLAPASPMFQSRIAPASSSFAWSNAMPSRSRTTCPMMSRPSDPRRLKSAEQR